MAQKSKVSIEELTFLDKDLMEYASVKYWFESLRSESNKKKCRNLFPRFLVYVKKDPDAILKSRIENLKSDDKRIKFQWETIVKNWYHEIYREYEEEGKSTYSAFTELSVVQSFFAHNRYPLVFARKELLQPKGKIKDYVPTQEDVKTMVSIAETHRDKSMILALAQSGLSPVDVANMNIEDFEDKWKQEFIAFEGYREKTTVYFQTCFGLDWIGVTLKMLKKQGNPHKGPLYVQESGKGAGKRITPSGINKAVMRIWDLLNIPTGSEVFMTKNLRDTFNNALVRAEVQERTAERMMGWKLAGAKSHYKLAEQTIIEAYKKAWRYLTIDGFGLSMPKDQEIAEVFARMLQINAIEDPVERQRETLKLIDELKTVSMDFEEAPSFKAMLKNLLLKEGA